MAQRKGWSFGYSYFQEGNTSANANDADLGSTVLASHTVITPLFCRIALKSRHYARTNQITCRHFRCRGWTNEMRKELGNKLGLKSVRHFMAVSEIMGRELPRM